MTFIDNFPLGNTTFDANGINGDMDEDEVELWLLENKIGFERRPISWCEQDVLFEATSGVELELCADELMPVDGLWKAHLSSLLLRRR